MSSSMSESKGSFPFPSTLKSEEPLALKHIRDYSNFLIPDGVADLLASGAIYARGIVVNILVMLPWLLILAAATIFFNPTRAELPVPGPLGHLALYIVNIVPRWFGTAVSDAAVGHFAITFAMLVAFVIFLVLGGFNLLRDWEPEAFAETSGFWTKSIGKIFLVTVIAAICEIQTVILSAKFVAHGDDRGLLDGMVNLTLGAIALSGSVLSFFARTFEQWIGRANKDAKLTRWLRAILAKAAILVAASVVPVLLWSAYFFLSYWGIADCGASLKAEPVRDAVFNAAKFFFPQTPLSNLAVCELFPFALNWPVVILYLTAAVLLICLSHLLDPNRNSLHRVYRDRLSKAFLFVPPGSAAKARDATKASGKADSSKPRNGANAPRADWFTYMSNALAGRHQEVPVLPNDRVKLSELSAEYAPYHLINTALNIQNSKYVNRRGRNADFFVFSPEFVGSVATGYAKTKKMEEVHRDFDLATAMAISGAAISSNMGSNTVRLMTPTLTALNFRLGFWLRNPNWLEMRFTLGKRLIDLFNLYFFGEMFGLLRETSWRVYLTDGGHVENLGIYELLRRECKLIVAIDAEADPDMNFSSLVKLERYARIDLGVLIDLPWRRLRAVTLDTDRIICATGEPGAIESRRGPHCVVGRIQYPTGEGYLVYVKSSLSGDENDYILDYKRRNHEFPHETIGDQFFSEEQFEVYRALGFHALHAFMEGSEETPTYFDRKDEKGETPLLYARPASPKDKALLDMIRSLLVSAPASQGQQAQHDQPAQQTAPPLPQSAPPPKEKVPPGTRRPRPLR